LLSQNWDGAGLPSDWTISGTPSQSTSPAVSNADSVTNATTGSTVTAWNNSPDTVGGNVLVVHKFFFNNASNTSNAQILCRWATTSGSQSYKAVLQNSGNSGIPGLTSTGVGLVKTVGGAASQIGTPVLTSNIAAGNWYRLMLEWLAYASIFKVPPKPIFEQHWSTWGSAYGGSNISNGNATVGSNNVTTDIFGFAAGMDYNFTPDLLARLCACRSRSQKHH
jgi:hypothetical protein